MITGPLFEKIYNCSKKHIVNQGGTSSGKTVTTLQALAIKAIEKRNQVITIVGQDIPNLKKGALRDFQRHVISNYQIAAQIDDYNKTDRIYTFKNGSVIEFNAYQDEQDAKSGKRDYSFFNEANGIPYMVYWQVAIRTAKQCYIDYNPTSPFWVHDKLIGQPDTQLYITDHRHNPFLTQDQHNEIESISDPDLFRVYARGMTGKIKGLIFGHFKKIDIVPEIYHRIIWGIDYGYTNDPTALVKIYCAGRKRYHEEICYETGLPAETIKTLLLSNGLQRGQVIYSEADPNMINQLRILGLPVIPAIKGPGSIAAGISKVKEYECYYTTNSINFEREIQQYKWVTAQDLATGKEVMTNQPMDAYNHLCDATRFAIYTDSFKHR
jgi:phage terminase large subunit